ncbi:MAG: nucleoside deaminase [Marinomonas sp.]
MNQAEQDNHWLKQALNLSQAAVDAGNHPFGALLVLDNKQVLKAENTVNTCHDATRHAEMNLVSQACQNLSENQRKEAVLYTSTEPCAMCAGAIYWSGIKQVVYACSGSELNDIAGKSLICHSEDVFEGAINPPSVRSTQSQLLIEQACEQHKKYWIEDWSCL